MNSSAVISDDGLYRYDLRRAWDFMLPAVAFVMLNPSTADAAVDDPTIRRCIGFAQAWGYGSLIVRNCFAYRATDPKQLRTASDPIGPDNDRWLTELSAAELVVAAWGVNATLYGRDRTVRRILHNLGCEVATLGVTKAGHPKHPLYVPAATERRPLEGAL